MFCFAVSKIHFDVWILDTCYDNSSMLMILASIYLQLHLYGPIVNKSHQEKEILINTICRRSWYIAAHIWKIYDFKIEVVPLIINFSTELTTVVKFEV